MPSLNLKLSGDLSSLTLAQSSPSKIPTIPHFKNVTWRSGQEEFNHLFDTGTRVAGKPVPCYEPSTWHSVSDPHNHPGKDALLVSFDR